MKYEFSGTAIVEASSEEEALTKIGGRLAAITRHLGNGEQLAQCRPFFTLKGNVAGEPTDLADPIVAARLAAEAAAVEAEKPAEEREAETITAADVGKLEDVLGKP